jgi:hypothetical protein
VTPTHQGGSTIGASRGQPGVEIRVESIARPPLVMKTREVIRRCHDYSNIADSCAIRDLKSEEVVMLPNSTSTKRV